MPSGNYQDTKSPLEVLQFETLGIASLTEGIAEVDSFKQLFIRKNMSEANNISKTIYDTESYYAEDEKEPTALFSVDTSTQEVYIDILKHEYQKNEYEYTIMGDEIPHVNMPWRNAVTFLGRLIVDNEVKYKGTITLQYDGERHHILIVKPWQVNYATFSQETNISYNALDPYPFIFEDLLHEDADMFSYPTVLGVTPYNIRFEMPNPGNNAKFAKVFSSFDRHQKMFLRPYFAIPKMPQLMAGGISPDMFNMTLVIRMYADDEGERYPLDITLTGDGGIYINWEEQGLIDFLYRIFDLNNSHNHPIRVSLISEAVRDETITSSNTTRVPVPTMTNQQEVLSNLLGKEEPLRYIINTRTKMITPNTEGGTIQYESTIRISRSEPVYDLDTGAVLEYNRLHVEDIKIWTNDAIDAEIAILIPFEGLNFQVNLAYKEGSVYVYEEYTGGTTVDVDATEKFRHVSTGSTQIIRLRGEKLVDPNEMLKQHVLKNATMMKNLDRYILLYGPHTGSNVIQFLGYDQIDYAPYPSGAIDFDSEITHIHSHRNALYVFTTGGLYLLHSGFGPEDMRKTFAYANVNLDHAEKQTVVSFGNEVFYISKGVGYAIRTNVNVESQDDVYVQPVTHPIGDLLKNPAAHIKQRLEEGYGRVIDVYEDLKVSYYTKASNSELYIFASYYVQNNDDEESIMVTYIFNKDYRRWTMYDTIAGTQVISDLTSGSAKGFDILLKNHYDKGHITYGGYLYSIPQNTLDKSLGDIRVTDLNEDDDVVYDLTELEGITSIYNYKPLSVLLDTGALAFNPAHNKKIRRITTTLLDLKGDGINIYMVPHIDYHDYQNRLRVETAVGETGEYVPDYIENVNELSYSPMMPIISPKNLVQEGFRLSIANLQSTRKVELLTQMNAKGKMPGFRMYIFAEDQFKISDYGIIYRQQKAR